MNDCVRLPRSALTDELWRDKDLWQLYGYLLYKADENGVVETSLATIQHDLKISQKPLRTMLSKLERANKAAKQGASKGSKITLCEIADYPKQGASKRAKQEANRRASEKVLVSTPPKVVITPSFVAPEYAETWQKFISYRKEIKKPYKSEASERIAYNKMVEMANNDPVAAKDMVERTILGQWQGLFPKENHGSKQIITTDNATTRKDSRDRLRHLATGVVSQSSDKLLDLYDGRRKYPDDSRH